MYLLMFASIKKYILVYSIGNDNKMKEEKNINSQQAKKL